MTFYHVVSDIPKQVGQHLYWTKITPTAFMTVFTHKKIVERGSRDELIAASGNYSRLWSAQAEYYKDTAGELFE